MQRAQANLFETLPLFAAAVLVAHAAGREGQMTLWDCHACLAARVVYVPLYAAGIPVLRSLVWCVSIAGLVMLLVTILRQRQAHGTSCKVVTTLRSPFSPAPDP